MTEEQFLDSLIGKRGLARILGWTTAHFRPAKTEKGWRTAVAGDGQGFPDLVLARWDVHIPTTRPYSGRTIFGLFGNQ